MPVNQPTYELLRKDRDGAIAVLYERYGKKLVGYAIRQWQLDEDEAWELTYKTLYRILETHANYQFVSEEKFSAFVFTAFINYLRNFYRNKKNKSKDGETVPLDEANLKIENNTETIPSPQLIALRAELDKFEDWERMLLLLRSQDVPYSEIAKLTGKPESQLKVYYMRLKKRLAERLNQPLTSKNNEQPA
jgi:RNA polymerase sigma factor (sigma-70 family)